MVELILIRHANAGLYTEPDFDRSLSEKGKLEANQSAQILKYSNHQKGIWLCSSAKRTLETAQIIREKNPTICGELQIDEYWYKEGGKKYLEKIYEQKDPTLFLVGHNPSISFLASHFTNQAIQMQTAEIIHLQWEYADNWMETSANSAEIIYQYHPNI
ncbi:SixA phosphatase family protein [Aquirufa sp. ROCK2-A2]